jgi:PAS domain S-box-containing protein
MKPEQKERERQIGERTGQGAEILEVAQEWRATVDAIRDAVCLLDPEGRIRRCNRRMQELLDLPFDRITGHSCWELVYGQRTPPEGCEIGGESATAVPRPVVTWSIQDRWYAVSLNPIMDADGALVGAVHVMVDLSESKRTEEALKHYGEQLKTLHEIDLAILEVRPPSEIARDALIRLRDGMSLAGASITLFDQACHDADVFVVVNHGVTTPKDMHVVLDPVWVASLNEGIACELPDPRLVLPFASWGKSFEEAGIAGTLAVPLVNRGQLIGSLNLGLPESTSLSSVQKSIVSKIAVALAVSLENARLFQSVSEQRQMLHDLGTRMTNVEEGLRKRLAQELHDRVGQVLTALGINLTHVRGLLGDRSADVIERLNETLRQIEEISDSIRDVMAELRPAVLDDYGLVAALRWYAQQFAHRTMIDVDVVEITPTARIEQESETALFRIAQEALTNISKHAHATEAVVSVNSTSQSVILQIKDNGIGFEQPAGGLPRGGHGWGLMTMRERAESVNGSCFIDSRVAHGTTISVKLRRRGCHAKANGGSP